MPRFPRSKPAASADAWSEAPWTSWQDDEWLGTSSAWQSTSDWQSTGWASPQAAVQTRQRGRNRAKGRADQGATVGGIDEDLAIRAANAAEIHRGLPSTGKTIWQVLKTCIETSIEAGAAHFERSLRFELETWISDDVTLERQSGSQWRIMVQSGRHEQEVFYASVRSEVVGEAAAAREALGEIRNLAGKVKRRLLQDKACWLRSLADQDDPEQIEEFLEECKLQEDGGKGRGKGAPDGGEGSGDDAEYCDVCGKQWSQDLLGGTCAASWPPSSAALDGPAQPPATTWRRAV